VSAGHGLLACCCCCRSSSAWHAAVKLHASPAGLSHDVTRPAPLPPSLRLVRSAPVEASFHRPPPFCVVASGPRYTAWLLQQAGRAVADAFVQRRRPPGL